MDLTVVRTDHGLCGFLIERVLHLVDGLLKALLAAERLDELHDAAHRGEGRHLQHVGVVEIEHALVAILLQQRVEHGAGLRPILGEHVALLDVARRARGGSAASGRRRRGRSDRRDRGSCRVRPRSASSARPFGFQLLDDRLLAFRPISSA